MTCCGSKWGAGRCFQVRLSGSLLDFPCAQVPLLRAGEDCTPESERESLSRRWEVSPGRCPGAVRRLQPTPLPFLPSTEA